MKKIESPSGIDLRPEAPAAVRLSKRAGIIGLVVVTAVIGMIGYGVASRRHNTAVAMERSDPKNLTAASDAGKAIAAQIPAGVLTGTANSTSRPEPALRPPADSAARPALHGNQVAARPYVPPQQPAAPVPEQTPEERARAAAYRLELEAMSAPTATRAGFAVNSGLAPALPARENDMAQMTALLQAMQGPQRGAADPVRGAGAGARISLGGGETDEDYASQNMQDQKSAFLEKARSGTARENYSKFSRVRPLGKYEIKEGWDIPALLEQQLNSDLPGEIRALVRENVYDTASGKYLLIPQGSRLIGVYDSRIAYGQDGVTVVWNRIVFPDGSSINLDGMAGQDAQGRSGLRHDVDNHYRRLLGFAILTSGFSAAFQLSQSRRDSLLAYPSAAETAGSAVGRELSRLGADITRRNLNVQPTIKVPVGFRFNVRVNRDLLFEAPYYPYEL